MVYSTKCIIFYFQSWQEVFHLVILRPCPSSLSFCISLDPQPDWLVHKDVSLLGDVLGPGLEVVLILSAGTNQHSMTQ